MFSVLFRGWSVNESDQIVFEIACQWFLPIQYEHV